MAKLSKQRLTWFLIKGSIKDSDAFIDNGGSGALQRYRIPDLDDQRDSLFLKASSPRPPKWLRYVEAHLDDGQQLPAVLGASSSGVLVVPAGKRLLAVTFGYGRFLIKPDAIEQDFGLKVVLNSVVPNQIKSVDARTFDELTIHTRRGVSRDSPFAAFNLDVARDLLRGITGTSSREGLRGALTGAAALTMNTTLQVPRLPELAQDLVGAYRAKQYRKHFEFIDHMRAERDPGTIAQLDEKLVNALKARALTDMHLAIPEAIDWQEVAGTRFSFKRRKQEPTPDPKISVYRDLRDPDDLTIERLKRDKVEAISSVDEDQLRGHWRVYDCMVFETDYSDHLYVLSGGAWYRISKSYRDDVEASVRALPQLDVGLPAAQTEDDESAYNASAASAIGGLNLDGRLLSVGGYDRVELCDLLLKNGLFIHVKKRGRSSTLSHLFAQGVTSAQLLLHDEKFRDDARSLVQSVNPSFAATIPGSAAARDSIKVAYVVISRSQRKDRPFGLPFFSLVSLQTASRTLRDAGIEVLVQEIKET